MKDRIKRFFMKDTHEIKDDSVEEKNGDVEDFGAEESFEAEKEMSDEEKQLCDYTLKEIMEIKDKLGNDEVLCDILSEEFDVFSQSRNGSLAEKYEAFAKLKTLMKPKAENKKEETVTESEGRLHSGFCGGGRKDVSTGLTKRQMDMARSAGMSFKEYEELLVSAPTGRKNRF